MTQRPGILFPHSPFGTGDREDHFGEVDLPGILVGVVDFVAPIGLLLHQLDAAADRSRRALPLEVGVVLKRVHAYIYTSNHGDMQHKLL